MWVSKIGRKLLIVWNDIFIELNHLKFITFAGDTSFVLFSTDTKYCEQL